MATKTVARVWVFASDSNPSKQYQTLQYSDNSTSCECPGWTRRVDAYGSRTCKHIRLIDTNRADAECVSSHEYASTVNINTRTPYATQKKSTIAASQPVQRKLILK